ncbi:MAG: hypothetical protein AB7R90_21385 [Reyranellaceae bacterium]
MKLKQLRQQLDAQLAIMETHKEKGGEEYDRAKADAERLKVEIAAEEQRAADAGQNGKTNASPAPVDSAAAAEAERTRILEIDGLCRKHGVKDEDRSAWLKDGNMTVDAVRTRILEGLAAGSDQLQERGQIRITRDAGDTLREGVEEALMHRADPGKNKLTDKGRPYRGMALREIGRAYLEDAFQVRTRGMDIMELAGVVLGMQRAGGMLGTSDFPNILANVANKTLRMAYEEYPRTFLPFCRRVSATDFKPINRVALSGAPNLLKINESGEYKRGSLGETGATYALATYGRVVPITRKVIINDDVDAFTRVPALFGDSAAALESDIIWAIITENPTMADGYALFAAEHGNLGTAGVIAEDTLSEMRKLMALQKGIDPSATEEGRTLNLSPSYIMVPPSQLTTAQKWMATTYVPTGASGVNVFAGKYEVISEPRLEAADDKTWYAAASPNRIDTIEYCYLAGQESVYLEQRVGFDVDGIELKARHDFAGGLIEHRGLFKNPYT